MHRCRLPEEARAARERRAAQLCVPQAGEGRQQGEHRQLEQAAALDETRAARPFGCSRGGAAGLRLCIGLPNFQRVSENQGGGADDDREKGQGKERLRQSELPPLGLSPAAGHGARNGPRWLGIGGEGRGRGVIEKEHVAASAACHGPVTVCGAASLGRRVVLRPVVSRAPCNHGLVEPECLRRRRVLPQVQRDSGEGQE
mmetsp:Transcript_24840/g.80212  ORF Transcript_24840/g.80212 Transcript_24840/m.80212 type:complete len:200 (+) Transcript_24840:845-1444(+)